MLFKVRGALAPGILLVTVCMALKNPVATEGFLVLGYNTATTELYGFLATVMQECLKR